MSYRARERISKAQTRYDRAAKKYWELLGWGTSAEVQKARDALRKAEEGLDKAKESYERIKVSNG